MIIYKNKLLFIKTSPCRHWQQRSNRFWKIK